MRLPTGTVTFLFTDVEGSTRLLREHGDSYAELLGEHRRVLREALARHGGVEVDTQGDAFFVAFARASDALAAATDAQRGLGSGPVKVRIGIHTGEPLVTDEGYVGIDVHRAARIAAVGHGRQILLSQATRDLAGDSEVRDLGEHRLKDLLAPERIWQLGDGEFPPLNSLFQTNLPVQPNQLVGRERELREIGAYLRNGTRLLTLTGPGGSGKTRLALHAAADVAGEFSDGVWFVPLAPVTDPTLVEPTIAQVLEVSKDLHGELRGRRLLLVLDNFEQVVGAAVSIADLLAVAPAIRVLATSRERLAIAVEQEYVVSPLPPSDAAALFIERARRLQSSFDPDTHVAEIVRRLDGLPLAVELAAARTKVLTPEQISARLGKSLDLLTSRGRDVPERQRTLRATIAWSFGLLAEEERRVFASLAVFVGSFDLVAAEAVCSAEIDVVESLVEKSLLRRTGEGRFFLLETIGEYAHECFAELAERELLQDGHYRYFLDLALAAKPALRSPDRDEWIARLEADYPNIREALGRAAETAPEDELRFALALAKFWLLRLHLSEGHRWLADALERAPDAPVAHRADATYELALFATDEGDYAEARTRFEQSLEIYRAVEDAERVAFCLSGLALLAHKQGDLAEARVLFEAAIEQARGSCTSLEAAGIASNLGLVEMEEGNDERASELFQQAFVEFREAGDPNGVAIALENLGFVELRRGRLADASSLFTEAFDVGLDVGVAVSCLIGFAGVAAAEGRPVDSARLLGAMSAIRDEAHLTLEPLEADCEVRALTEVRRSLDTQALEAALAEGRAMTPAEAIESKSSKVD